MMQQMSGSANATPPQQNVSAMPGFGEAQSSTGDDWTEQQLDKWLVAKRSRDFVTADAIRDELRGMGIDPDTVRPRGWEHQAGNGSTGDALTEQQLDQWVAAKRQKDFATADALREELRAKGIDPDTVRPANAGGGKGFGKANAGGGGADASQMENTMMQ